MLPLVGLAISIVPELIHLIAGDKAGTVASDISKVVQDATGTSNPIAARQKLNDDPAVAAEVQTKLAALAIEATKATNAEAESRRLNELSTLRAALVDKASARTTMLSLAQSGSGIAWGAPVVSIVVTAGFFVFLTLLITHELSALDQSVAQILNIAAGGLITAFSTVVSYWLGSSQGSRNKDDTIGALVTGVTPTQPIQDHSPQTQIPEPGMADNFHKCLSIVLANEGGYADVPGDSGGPTNFGITLKTLADWREKEVGSDDVKALHVNEAAEIYRAKYWLPAGCGDLPHGIDLVVFDFGVNAGVRQSVKLLQRILGLTTDGSVGPITLNALSRFDPHKMVSDFSSARIAYYKTLNNFAEFGKGWQARTDHVKAAADLMIGS